MISISTAISICRMATSATKDTLAEALVAIAGSEARAAARAIEDSGSSYFPRDQMLAAASLLRGAHQKYTDAANRLGFWAKRGYGKSNEFKDRHDFADATRQEQARFDAAMTALTLAVIFREIGDYPQSHIWRERAEDDFENSYKRMPNLNISAIEQVGSYPARVPSPSDIEEYEYECDRLSRQFQAARNSLS